MADVFISYSSEERAQAEKLAGALEARGYSVWWDRNLEGGADFSDDIEREMQAAGTIVVAWSEQAAKSHWVRDEASYGRDAGKLVPISLDGSQPPIGFRQVQTIDFVGWSGGDDERVARLASAIERCCGKESVEPVAVSKAASSKVAVIVAVLGAIFMLAVGGWWLSRDGGEQAVAEMEAATTSVAVLPFRSLSDNDDDRYFAEGVTQEILNRLAALPELRVTSRSSSFQFADSDLPLNEIADELKVSHLVDGSVRRAGDTWRVSAELVRAADGVQLWSDTYDATGDDILRVQEEISERAAEALGVLLDDEGRDAMERAGINNPEAYAVFSEALESFERAHRVSGQYAALAETVELADRAFELEPRLWQAQLIAIDRPSHLLSDNAIGAPIDPEVTPQQARAEISSRLTLARNNAPASVYPALDQQALLYSNSWRNARQVVEALMDDSQSCQIGLSYDDFLVQEFDLVDKYLDYSRAKILCDPVQGKATLLEAALYARDAETVREMIDQIDNDKDNNRRFGPDLRAKVLAHLFLGEPEKAEAVLQYFDRNSYFHFQAQTMIAGARGDRDELQRLYDLGTTFPVFPDAAKIHLAAMMGDRAMANEIAARIDARGGGPAWLVTAANTICYCGRMFDLSATPNLARMLREANTVREPQSPIDWPLKDW